jgi:serine/threonine protein kinase
MGSVSVLKANHSSCCHVVTTTASPSVAEHIETGIKVAIKIINKGRIKSLDMMDKVSPPYPHIARHFGVLIWSRSSRHKHHPNGRLHCESTHRLPNTMVVRDVGVTACAPQVRREIHILSMCRHPHIIRLYEVSSLLHQLKALESDRHVAATCARCSSAAR